MSDNTKVVTGDVRLSFPKLFEPEPNDQGVLKFSTMFMFPKSDKDTLAKLRAAEKAAHSLAKEKFPGFPAKPASVIKDGDGEDSNGEPYADKYPERAGQWFLSVSTGTKYPPKVVNGQLQPILDQSEIYPGVWARVSLNAYGYVHKSGKKGITFGLGNVQKIRDDEHLGGVGGSVEDDFDVFDDELI